MTANERQLKVLESQLAGDQRDRKNPQVAAFIADLEGKIADSKTAIAAEKKPPKKSG